jgi:hypothetical protein
MPSSSKNTGWSAGSSWAISCSIEAQRVVKVAPGGFKVTELRLSFGALRQFIFGDIDDGQERFGGQNWNPRRTFSSSGESVISRTAFPLPEKPGIFAAVRVPYGFVRY